MKHPLDILVVAEPLHFGDRCIDPLGWDYPDRVPVVVRGQHPPPTAGPVAARIYYAETGRTARLRPRMNRGRIVYRLPWRMWRWRHMDASGDWRGNPDREGRLELIGILLFNAGGRSFP